MKCKSLYATLLCLAVVAILAMSATAVARVGGEQPMIGADRSSGPAQGRHVPRTALVQFRPGVTRAEAKAIALRAGGHVAREIRRYGANDRGRLFVVRSARLSTAQLVASLAADPRVDFAEPDYIRQPDASPNDPRFIELWGMKKIAATQAWNLTTGSAGVVVADIDSGADYAHPDLAANMWKNPGEFGKTPGVDDDHNGYVDDIYGIDTGDDDVDPMDNDAESEGHGSHTAGTIAAVGNNGVGVTGVCWTARVMVLKFLGGPGGGSTSGEIECIQYAIWQKQHGVNVVAINASFGSENSSQAEKDAVQAAGNAGIVFVTSAGNGGDDGVGDNNDVTAHYPSNYTCTNIITVAATDQSDTLTSFSNYGATSVDVAAPGDEILSTVPTTVDPSGYVLMPGTSMATPHVTGTVALCADAFPSDTAAQRINRVLSSVDKVGGLTGKCTTGGRLNAAKALGITPSTGPEMLELSSSTHPDPNQWYTSRSVSFVWEGEPKCSVAASLGWGGYSNNGMAEDIEVVGHTAYVADWSSGVRIVDVTNPGQPANLGAFQPANFLPKRVAVEGHYAYANGYEPAFKWGENRFLVIIDVSDPGAPSLVSYFTFMDGDNVWTVKDVAVRGGKAYLGVEGVSSVSGNIEYWLYVLDMSDPTVWADPAAGTVLGACQLSPGSAAVTWSGFTLRGDHLYIGGDRLRIVDIADPTSPTVVGSAADPVTAQYCNDPAVDDAHAFVACHDAMRVFDITQAAQPRSVAGFDIPSNYFAYEGDRIAVTDTDSALKHHYAFFSFSSTGWVYSVVRMIDISDPLTPVDLGVVALPGSGHVDSMTVNDGLLYVGRQPGTAGSDEVLILRPGPAGYSYVFDQTAGTVPDATPDGTASGLSGRITSTASSDGVWYFHVRAIDSTGGAGPTVTRKVQIGAGAVDTTPPVTTASGYDDAWHTSPVTVSFSASDPGSNASGVAYTEYRLDSGAWTHGNSCIVPAPANTQHTYTVGYRSADNANNLETEKTVQVKIDTRVSPPTITLLIPNHGKAGDAVTITGTNLGSSGSVKFNSTTAATSSWMATQIVCTVPAGLSAGSVDVTVTAGGQTSAPFAFTIDGTDTTHTPATTVTGADDRWQNKDVLVVFAITDSGDDVDELLYSVDGLAWEELGFPAYNALSFKAPTDHTNDGDHTLSYKARDLVGSEEVEHSLHVKIDTRKPATKAPYAAVVRKGRTATLKYKIVDTVPNGGTARVTIKIKNRSGKVVKTLRPGNRNVNTVLGASFTCKLAGGSYRFFVYAVDAAGNAQAGIGSNRLTVK